MLASRSRTLSATWVSPRSGIPALPHLRRSGPATLKWLVRRATATTSQRGKRKKPGTGPGSSRIRQLEQYLAVTGLGCAPASEILAAQFRQRGDQFGAGQQVITIFRDHLGARAVASDFERVCPFAARQP